MKKITFMVLTAMSLAGWNAQAQFAESFDAGIPASFTVLNQDGGAYTWAAGTIAPHTGAGNAVIHWESAAHDDYLISPAITVAAGVNDRFSFYAGINGTFWTEAYEVRLSTTGTAAADFTVLLDSGTITTDAVVGDYTRYLYNLSDYVGQTVYVAIVAVDTDRFYVYVDDVVSDALPSCVAPTEGVATVTSATTAEFTWVSGGAANAEIVIQAAGTGLPPTQNNTGEAATGNTYAADQLSPATAYEFYVRDECTDGTDLSEWAGPFLFDTTQIPGCATLTAPANGSTVPVGDVVFEWTAPTTGDPAASYDLYYGIAPDDVSTFFGNFEDTTATAGLTDYNFTFYWRIVPINAGGEAVGCEGDIWSFTTEPEPTAPANDDCFSATALTPAGDFASAAILTTNAGATNTEGVVPDCQSTVIASVWYTVVVPASGTLTLETQAAAGSPFTDTILEVYSGTCGALVAVDCNDDNEDGLFSTLSLTTGITAGQTLYVGVYGYGSSGGIPGAFQLAAYDASLLATDSFDNGAFAAYPNPVTDVLNLSYTKDINDVAVYNMLGQQVYAQTLNAKNAKIDLSFLNSGNYIVKLTSDKEVKTLKVMKQ